MTTHPEAEPQPGPPPRVELPEGQPVLSEDRWREIALYLYAQLDNIDTLYDACRGNRECFYHNVAKYHSRRHEVAVTDGYRVVFLPENRDQVLLAWAQQQRRIEASIARAYESDDPGSPRQPHWEKTANGEKI